MRRNEGLAKASRNEQPLRCFALRGVGDGDEFNLLWFRDFNVCA